LCNGSFGRCRNASKSWSKLLLSNIENDPLGKPASEVNFPLHLQKWKVNPFQTNPLSLLVSVKHLLDLLILRLTPFLQDQKSPTAKLFLQMRSSTYGVLHVWYLSYNPSKRNPDPIASSECDPISFLGDQFWSYNPFSSSDPKRPWAIPILFPSPSVIRSYCYTAEWSWSYCSLFHPSQIQMHEATE